MPDPSHLPLAWFPGQVKFIWWLNSTHVVARRHPLHNNRPDGSRRFTWQPLHTAVLMLSCSMNFRWSSCPHASHLSDHSQTTTMPKEWAYRAISRLPSYCCRALTLFFSNSVLCLSSLWLRCWMGLKGPHSVAIQRTLGVLFFKKSFVASTPLGVSTSNPFQWESRKAEKSPSLSWQVWVRILVGSRQFN